MVCVSEERPHANAYLHSYNRPLQRRSLNRCLENSNTHSRHSEVFQYWHTRYCSHLQLGRYHLLHTPLHCICKIFLKWIMKTVLQLLSAVYYFSPAQKVETLFTTCISDLLSILIVEPCMAAPTEVRLTPSIWVVGAPGHITGVSKTVNTRPVLWTVVCMEDNNIPFPHLFHYVIRSSRPCM